MFNSYSSPVSSNAGVKRSKHGVEAGVTPKHPGSLGGEFQTSLGSSDVVPSPGSAS